MKDTEPFKNEREGRKGFHAISLLQSGILPTTLIISRQAFMLIANKYRRTLSQAYQSQQ